jgi:hypothetical protein
VGWVVKQWRTEAAREHAERDARRARRAAERATAGVAAQLEALEALERLGLDLRASVGERRAATATTAAAVAAAAREAPAAPEAPDAPQPPEPAAPVRPADHGRPAPRRRTERASLRGSALGELFRATEPRRAGPAAPGA